MSTVVWGGRIGGARTRPAGLDDAPLSYAVL